MLLPSSFEPTEAIPLTPRINNLTINMCQVVRYVYPSCGHPIRPGSDAAFIERCRIAHDTDRNCWIPRRIPPEFVQERACYDEDVAEECAECLASNVFNVEDAGSFFEEEEEGDDGDGDDNGEEDVAEEDATQRSTGANAAEEELRATEDLRWARNKLIEIDDDEETIEQDIPPEDRSLGSASMDLEGSQPSEMGYR